MWMKICSSSEPYYHAHHLRQHNTRKRSNKMLTNLQVLQVYRMDGVNSALLILQLTTLYTQFQSFNATMLCTGELLTFLNQCSEDAREKRGIIFHNPWTTNEVGGKKSLSMTKLTVEKLCLCCCSPHTHKTQGSDEDWINKDWKWKFVVARLQ